jgi:quinol monooxygenase YgiN
MTENVFWLYEVAVNPGRIEDLKTLMATLVDATRRNETGTINYEWAISNDQKVCHIYERYQDSAAVMTHLKSFAANYAGRFLEVVTPIRLIIYGKPNQEVKDALARINPIFMEPLGGFNRS